MAILVLTCKGHAETMSQTPTPVIGTRVGFSVPSGSSNQSAPTKEILVSLSSPNALQLCPAVTPGEHDQYHLPPTTNLLEGISFATDWTRHPTGGWYGAQIMDECRMRPDGSSTWHGKAAVSFGQPKDDPLALHKNSERSEMMIMQEMFMEAK